MFTSISLITIPKAHFEAMNVRLQQLGTECATQANFIGLLQQQVYEKDKIYQESVENILILSHKYQALNKEIESLKNERDELTEAKAALETKAANQVQMIDTQKSKLAEQGHLLAAKASIIGGHRDNVIKKKDAIIDDMTTQKKLTLEEHQHKVSELNKIIGKLSEDKKNLHLEIQSSQDVANTMGQQVQRLQAEALQMSSILTKSTTLLQETQQAFASYKANAEESERRFIASQVELRNTSLELAATKKKLTEAEAKLAQAQAPSATQSAAVSALAAHPTKMIAGSAGRASSSPKSIMFGPTVLIANPSGKARSQFTPDHP